MITGAVLNLQAFKWQGANESWEDALALAVTHGMPVIIDEKEVHTIAAGLCLQGVVEEINDDTLVVGRDASSYNLVNPGEWVVWSPVVEETHFVAVNRKVLLVFTDAEFQSICANYGLLIDSQTPAL